LFIVIIALLTLVMSVILTRHCFNPQSYLYILDHPNDRSLHAIAVPRTGGVAIVSAVLVGFILINILIKWDLRLSLISLIMVIVASLSYIDDRYGLTIKVRLFVQIICALLLSVGGLALQNITLPGFDWPLPLWLSITISIIFIVWMINLYNFMDGMDGFAGGMTVIGFTGLSILGYMAEHTIFFSASLVIAFSAAGFLIFNYPPARIFMGDTGSASLGFLAGAFSIWGSIEGIFPFWIAVLIFSPFIFDATVTLLKRLIRGDKIWEAHKTHYYQRLVDMGWGHKRTVMIEYGVMLFCSLTAITMSITTQNVQWIAIGLVLMMYIIFACYIDVIINR
jgi:UDP-N-acetylmuramyl pentapeptide phosphotransferase/UDP-N-acetylglucosamine-1-phosphate transferase